MGPGRPLAITRRAVAAGALGGVDLPAELEVEPVESGRVAPGDPVDAVGRSPGGRRVVVAGPVGLGRLLDGLFVRHRHPRVGRRAVEHRQVGGDLGLVLGGQFELLGVGPERVGRVG